MDDDTSPGEEIRVLSLRFASLSVWVDDEARSRVARLQLDLDAKSGLPDSIALRRVELEEEVKWRASEIDGCQKALTLVGSSSGVGVKTRPDLRLVSRMEKRGFEIAEIRTEIGLFAEQERQHEIGFHVAQSRLIDGLRRVVGDANVAKESADASRNLRRAMRAGFALAEDEMWSPTAVMAYRVWAVDKGRLFGARTEWKTSSLSAECDKPGQVPHTDGRCAEVAFGCGIYAAKSVSTLMSSYDLATDTRAVVGLTALEGKVVEHTSGYRAEEATVIAVAYVEGNQVRLIDHPSTVNSVFYGTFEKQADPYQIVAFVDSAEEMHDTIEEFMDQAARRNSQWT